MRTKGEGEGVNKESRAEGWKDQCGLHAFSTGEWWLELHWAEKKGGETHYIPSHLLGGRGCNKEKQKGKKGRREGRNEEKETGNLLKETLTHQHFKTLFLLECLLLWRQ